MSEPAVRDLGKILREIQGCLAMDMAPNAYGAEYAKLDQPTLDMLTHLARNGDKVNFSSGQFDRLMMVYSKLTGPAQKAFATTHDLLAEAKAELNAPGVASGVRITPKTALRDAYKKLVADLRYDTGPDSAFYRDYNILNGIMTGDMAIIHEIIDPAARTMPDAAQLGRLEAFAERAPGRLEGTGHTLHPRFVGHFNDKIVPLIQNVITVSKLPTDHERQLIVNLENVIAHHAVRLEHVYDKYKKTSIGKDARWDKLHSIVVAFKNMNRTPTFAYVSVNQEKVREVIIAACRMANADREPSFGPLWNGGAILDGAANILPCTSNNLDDHKFIAEAKRDIVNLQPLLRAAKSAVRDYALTP